MALLFTFLSLARPRTNPSEQEAEGGSGTDAETSGETTEGMSSDTAFPCFPLAETHA